MTQVRLARDVADELRGYDGSLSAAANRVLRAALGLPDGPGRPLPAPARPARPVGPAPGGSPADADPGVIPAHPGPGGPGPDQRQPDGHTGGMTARPPNGGRATARAARGSIGPRRLPRV